MFPEIDFYIPIVQHLDEETDKNLRYINNLHFEVLTENLALKSINPGLSKTIWEVQQLYKYFKGVGVDIIHNPYPSVYRRIEEIPVVETVHDVIPWTEKDYKDRSFLSSIYNKQTMKAAMRADKLITVSNSSKQEIEALNGFDGKEIEVVYNATEFIDAPELTPEDELNLLDRLGLEESDQFLFYMGGYDKRKNVQRLVDIFRDHIAPYTDLKLILGGGSVLGNSLFKQIDKGTGECSSRIIETGFLSNSDLIMLYRRSWTFITLTIREGFGLSPLEALTLGCPVIMSDLPVNREITGDAPLFLDLGLSDEKIAEAVTNLYNSPENYQSLKQSATDFASRSAQNFSWTESARKTGEIYLKTIR